MQIFKLSLKFGNNVFTICEHHCTRVLVKGVHLQGNGTEVRHRHSKKIEIDLNLSFSAGFINLVFAIIFGNWQDLTNNQNFSHDGTITYFYSKWNYKEGSTIPS